MARRARQRWLRVHGVFCTVCTFVPARPFFPKWYASYFPWNLSFFLLARVCYTADCNVLTLRRSSCSSTLPLFVQQTKDGPYLNLNLASKRYLYHHTKHPAEIKAPWTYNRQISQHAAYVSSRLSLLTGRCSVWKFTVCWAHYLFIPGLMTSRGHAGGINFEVCV